MSVGEITKLGGFLMGPRLHLFKSLLLTLIFSHAGVTRSHGGRTCDAFPAAGTSVHMPHTGIRIK